MLLLDIKQDLSAARNQRNNGQPEAAHKVIGELL
jgi:hypothetical protein